MLPLGLHECILFVPQSKNIFYPYDNGIYILNVKYLSKSLQIFFIENKHIWEKTLYEVHICLTLKACSLIGDICLPLVYIYYSIRFYPVIWECYFGQFLLSEIKYSHCTDVHIFVHVFPGKNMMIEAFFYKN